MRFLSINFDTRFDPWAILVDPMIYSLLNGIPLNITIIYLSILLLDIRIHLQFCLVKIMLLRAFLRISFVPHVLKKNC